MSAAERVRKLAALAGSDNEHEANSAARQACRIIREGKVVITEAGFEDAPAWYSRPSRPQAPQRPTRAPRRVPHGPFMRRPDVWAVECASCGEEIPAGDAFACAEGHVHGDCIPVTQRP